MSIDGLEEENKESVLRDISEDKEMQAYASVLYLLRSLRCVVPEDYVKFVEDYIVKKYPILGKVRFTNCLIHFCGDDMKGELKSITSLHNALASLPVTTKQVFDSMRIEFLDKVEPVHQEDKLVDIDFDAKTFEIANITLKSSVDDSDKLYIVDSDGKTLANLGYIDDVNGE